MSIWVSKALIDNIEHEAVDTGKIVLTDGMRTMTISAVIFAEGSDLGRKAFKPRLSVEVR